MANIVADVKQIQETAQMFKSASTRFQENFKGVVNALAKLSNNSNGSKALERQHEIVKQISKDKTDVACENMLKIANLLQTQAEEIEAMDRAE